MFADTNIIAEMSQNYCAVIDNTKYINESPVEVLNTFKEALMLVIIIIYFPAKLARNTHSHAGNSRFARGHLRDVYSARFYD